MSQHNLKTHPAAFKAVTKGIKTAEFRRNDRNFLTGDYLKLQEWIPDGGTEGGGYYTGEIEFCYITHIQTGFGIPDGFAMLSIKLL